MEAGRLAVVVWKPRSQENITGLLGTELRPGRGGGTTARGKVEEESLTPSSCKENNQAEEYGNWSNESVLSGVLIYILQSWDGNTRTRTDCMWGFDIPLYQVTGWLYTDMDISHHTVTGIICCGNPPLVLTTIIISSFGVAWPKTVFQNIYLTIVSYYQSWCWCKVYSLYAMTRP